MLMITTEQFAYKSRKERNYRIENIERVQENYISDMGLNTSLNC